MLEATTQPCPHCHGTGLVRSVDSLGLTILRQIEEEGVRKRSREVLVKAPVSIVNFLMNHKREHIAQIEARYGMAVRVEADPFLISPDFSIEKFKTATRVVEALPVISANAALMADIDEDEDIVEAEDDVDEPEEACGVPADGNGNVAANGDGSGREAGAAAGGVGAAQRQRARAGARSVRSTRPTPQAMTQRAMPPRPAILGAEDEPWRRLPSPRRPRPQAQPQPVAQPEGHPGRGCGCGNGGRGGCRRNGAESPRSPLHCPTRPSRRPRRSPSASARRARRRTRCRRTPRRRRSPPRRNRSPRAEAAPAAPPEPEPAPVEPEPAMAASEARRMPSPRRRAGGRFADRSGGGLGAALTPCG
jgi:ribonuclease E